MISFKLPSSSRRNRAHRVDTPLQRLRTSLISSHILEKIYCSADPLGFHRMKLIKMSIKRNFEGERIPISKTLRDLSDSPLAAMTGLDLSNKGLTALAFAGPLKTFPDDFITCYLILGTVLGL